MKNKSPQLLAKRIVLFCCLVLSLLGVSIKSNAQMYRVFNTDSIFFVDSQWTKRIENQLIPFDTSTVIIKFDPTVSRSSIISYLQSNQMVLIDSFYDYKLCQINNSFTFNTNLTSINNEGVFSEIELNSSAILNTDPNDPYFEPISPKTQNQFHYNFLTDGLNIPPAWTKTFGNRNVTVAVIDAEPNWSHPDLGKGSDGYENIWNNPKEDAWTDPNDPSTGDGIDNDGNGLIDDWKGWDFNQNDNDVRPTLNSYSVHGTNVAGIIAAKTNNELGMSGIAGGNGTLDGSNREGVKLLTINVFREKNLNIESGGTIWNVAKGINYAAINKANIIALSLSIGIKKSNILEFAINKAVNEFGCIVFCSAGNEINDVLQYPSYDVNVHAVSGFLENSIAQYNNHCIGNYPSKKLAFVALSEDVTATTINFNTNPRTFTYINTFQHTSAASPQASGVAALLYSYFNCATNKLVFQTMKETATNHDDGVGFEWDWTEEGNPIDGYKYSDKWGYGLPNAGRALDKLASYEVSTYTLTTNTTYTTPKIARENIIIPSGKTLTVESELYMSQGTAIIVEPGGNLIVDGGVITNGCGWLGIEVYGLDGQAQNASTFGEVTIKNEGKIENAWCGIKSIFGGIIKTETDAVFHNNWESIVFEKHTTTSFDQLSEIEYAHFISDGPFTPKITQVNGTVVAVKNFIRIIDTKNLQIMNNEFLNTYEASNLNNVSAIKGFNTPDLFISTNTFTGLREGVHITTLNGFKNNIYVEVNEFTNNRESVRIINSTGNVASNNFILPPQPGGGNNYTLKPFGVYMHSSVSKIFGNLFTVNEGELANGYGSILRFSKLRFESTVDYNIYSKLWYGTQIEGFNRKTFISCNDYTSISNSAWSINPYTINTNIFPEQGSGITGINQKRAGNLFNDRNQSEFSLKHIRSSYEFVYNAAEDPTEAVPEYISSEVLVHPFEESNSGSCPNGRTILCDETPCSIQQLLDLLELTKPDSVEIYHQQILALTSTINEAITLLIEWNTDGQYDELIFESYLNAANYTSASTVLSSITPINRRDSDYVYFYGVILNQYQNGLPNDSLTSTQFSNFTSIASRSNEVSDIVKAYLNFYKNENYSMEPELWEEEELLIIEEEEELESRIINNNIPTPETKETKKAGSLFLNIYPNPANNLVQFSFNNSQNPSIGKLVIYNAMGIKIEELNYLNPNQIYQINTNNYLPGIYSFKLQQDDETMKVKRVIILK